MLLGSPATAATLDLTCGAVAGSNKVFKEKNWRGMAAAKHNQDRSNSESDARLARAIKRDKVSLSSA